MSMTTEQREAIEKLEYVNRWYDCNNYYSRYELDCIETVLSLIKEQQKEIDKYKTLYERALSDVVKTDKQIDLMAEQLAGLTIWNSKKEEPLILTDKEDVKQYFERQVNSSKQ